jgi:hypothetical protein
MTHELLFFKLRFGGKASISKVITGFPDGPEEKGEK